jgi:hypothetical protein
VLVIAVLVSRPRTRAGMPRAHARTNGVTVLVKDPHPHTRSIKFCGPSCVANVRVGSSAQPLLSIGQSRRSLLRRFTFSPFDSFLHFICTHIQFHTSSPPADDGAARQRISKLFIIPFVFFSPGVRSGCWPKKQRAKPPTKDFGRQRIEKRLEIIYSFRSGLI